MIRPSLSRRELRSSTPSLFSYSSPLLGNHSTDGLFSSKRSSSSFDPREDWCKISTEPLFLRSGLFACKTPKTLSASSKSCRIYSMLDNASSSTSSGIPTFAFLPKWLETALGVLLKVCVRSFGIILSNSRCAISLNFKCLISMRSLVSLIWWMWDSILFKSRSSLCLFFWYVNSISLRLFASSAFYCFWLLANLWCLLLSRT